MLDKSVARDEFTERMAYTIYHGIPEPFWDLVLFFFMAGWVDIVLGMLNRKCARTE